MEDRDDETFNTCCQVVEKSMIAALSKDIELSFI